MPDQSLKGKIAVVTGAGRGIGKSTALTFAKAGADLAICARSKAEIEDVQREIQELGRTCVTGVFDLSSPAAATYFCNGIVDQFGSVNVLVNNAGAYLERGAFADSDPDLWWKTIEVNVRGPYLMTRHLVFAMNKGAKIINLTSGKGYNAGTNSSAYHVSKAALNMLTDCLANELWQKEIEVNSLVPGPTATATFDNAKPGEERSSEEILSAGPDALPKGLPAWERVKHPNEVAALALHLASQPNGGPTGQVYSLARHPM